MALAVLPLTGAAWFAIGEVTAAGAARTQAARVDASVTRLVLLTELQSRLLDERNWLSAAGVLDLGLDNELVLRLTGLDIGAEAESASRRVDELMVTLELDDLAERLEVTRSEPVPNLKSMGERYDAIESEVTLESQRTLDELLSIAGRIDGAERLVTTLRVLQASTEARQAISSEFTAFFSAQFSGEDSLSTDVTELVGQRSVRSEAEAKIERIVGPDSRSRSTIDAILVSPSVGRFDDAMSALIERSLDSSAERESLPLALTLVDIDGIAQLFQAGSDTTAIYLDLVSAAGLDALEASDGLGQTAERELDHAVASIIGLAVTSLLFAGAATRAIARPVRRLAEVSRRISDGDSSARFGESGGSIEIAEAGRAMDAAAAHLQLAEQQATALAEGNLDHPILSRVNTGQLGASLQSAVEALASSMQEREEFRRRMTHEATHDGLTRIANRNATLAKLSRGLARIGRSESVLAVLFIDLDGFKDVNDQHGHQAGDTVLRIAAQRLVNNVRVGDHVGRLGGDEFLVIAEPVGGTDDAVALAQRLLDILSEPIQVENTSVIVRASIGIAISDGTSTDDSTDLLRNADLAVYQAKAGGRNRIELCDEELRAAVFQRAEIERELRRAVDHHELTLFFQPIVEATSAAVRGYEALVRWNRPGHGIVGPDTFIPVAERSDLILSIDRWVVGAVVHQIRAWDDAGLEGDVPISVNISGRHLNSPSLIDDVLGPLRDHAVDPARLVVEITESALLEDLEGAAIKLQALRHKGIRTAIDDFGTGYTSLAHLKSLPIDILKIDRSFIRDESAASLVQLIVDTGHLLGATITAEGIETVEQAQNLVRMGADQLQGYLYGRPRPATGVGSAAAPPADGPSLPLASPTR